MQICISLCTLMVAVIVHPELVLAPGLDQIGAAVLVGISIIGISFSIQAGFADAQTADVAVRMVLMAFALLALFVPDYGIATAACVPVLSVIGYWVIYRRKAQTGEPEVVELEEKSLGLSTAAKGALGTMS